MAVVVAGAAADAAAEVAEVAAVAVAAAAAAVAVCLGVVAASAKPERFPTTLTNIRSSWPGSIQSTRPIHVFLAVPSTACVGRSAHDGRVGLPPDQEMPERRLDNGVSVVRENVLHQQTEFVRKLRMLKS